MIGSARWMVGIMVGNGHAVERNNFQRLIVEVKVHITVRGCIHDPPELPLTRGNRNVRTDSAVHGNDFFRRFGAAAADIRRYFHSF